MEYGSQHDELRELQRRLRLVRAGLLVLVGVLVVRLWQIQILSGPYYQNLSKDNTSRTVILEPARGLIYDRSGTLLANNVSSFSLYVTVEDVKNREALIQQLVRLVGLDEAVVRKKMSERAGKLVPRKLKEGLTLREAALVESRQLDLSGVWVQGESQRNYPLGMTASHVVGYVGEVSAEQLEEEEFANLHLGSIVGRYGVERTYDRFLRGKTGRKVIEADALGHERRTISIEKPTAGDDVYLTIDGRLQQLAEQLLGEEAGAIVAVDPTNGEVLALASHPAFDPNVLSRELTPRQWEAIAQNETHPLTNRATQGQYPPGSTFKIIMAAAALETDMVKPSTTVRCSGGFWFGRRLYRDWKAGGHGTMNLHTALVNSCDVYFYNLGERLGIDTIAAFAGRFGLGRLTGIDLTSEQSGTVPSSAWKKKFLGEPWYPGETISTAIGQGYLTVTPIQMAQVVATVANGGIVFRPHLVKGLLDRATGQFQEAPIAPSGQLAVKPKTWEIIRGALAGVVVDGTAKRARSSLVTIAGKTGTAQTVALRPGQMGEVPKKLRDHAWFVAYAPAEDPRIAVAVLVENMGHGSAAAPLAKQLIEAYARLTPYEPLVIPVVEEAKVARTALRERPLNDP